MAEKTMEQLEAERFALDEQVGKLMAQLGETNTALNTQRGKASLATVLRSAGVQEDSIAALVELRTAQIAGEAAKEVESDRLLLKLEASLQEEQNVRERAEFAAAIEAGQAPSWEKWAGCPSVDGLPPAPPRITFGNADLSTVRLGVQPGEGKG